MVKIIIKYKTIFFALGFMLTPMFASLAQNQSASKADSLFKEVRRAKKNIQRAELYLQIATAIKDTYPDSALGLVEKGFDYLLKEEKAKRPNVEQILLKKAFLLHRKADILSAFSRDYSLALLLLSQADSLADKVEKMNTRNRSEVDRLKGNINMIRGNIEFYTGNIDSSLKYLNTAAVFFERSGHTFDLMRCYNNLGSVNRFLENHGEALSYFTIARNYFQEINDKSFLSAVYTNIGLTYSVIGDLQLSAYNYQQAMRINEEIGNARFIAINSLNLGNIYLQLSDYDKAKQYYEISLEHNRKLNSRLGMANALTNLAGIYQIQGDTVKYEELFKEGEAIFKEIQNWDGYANARLKYGKSMLLRKNFGEAIAAFNDAKEVYERINSRSGIIVVNTEIARYFFQIGKLNQAINLAEENLAEAQALGLRPEALEMIDLLYVFWERKGNAAKALQYLKQYRSNLEEMMNSEKQKNILEMEARYQVEKKEKEIDLLRNQAEINSLRMRQQTLFIYLSIALILILLVLAFLFINRFIIKRNYSIKLEAAILQLQNANALVEERNQVRDKLFSVISHDLRSPFSGILGLTEILNDEIETLQKEEILEYTGLIHRTARQSLEVFENLLHWGRLQSGKIAPVPVQINIWNVIERHRDFFANNLKMKNIQFENNVGKEMKVFADLDLTEIVLRNLISNSVKFSFSGGKIIIDSQIEKGMCQVCVTNFGAPVPEDKRENLFALRGKSSTRGTFNEKGTGLGLVLCKEMVELNGGNIWLEQSNNEKTIFCFTLPQSKPG